MAMKQAEFINGLRVITAIDREDLVNAGVIEANDKEIWPLFRVDPFRWVARAKPEVQARIFRLVQARQPRSP